MKTLNVKKTTKKEVSEQWGFALPSQWPDTLYIRCNAKGQVNLDVSPVVYLLSEERVERGNYTVHQ